MSLSSLFMRAACTISDRKRDKGLQTPEGIQRFDNIQYGRNKKWNVLDVYMPKDKNKSWPVIVSIHGGGWVYGTKEVYQYYGMNLAERGFAVVNFSYRLAPKFKFPSQQEDTNKAMEWVLENADKYAFDTKRIYLVGDSAGANIAAAYSIMCTNSEYAAKYDFKVPQKFVPNAVALNCGIYCTRRAADENNMGFKKLMLDLLGKDRFDEKINLLNVPDFVTGNFPPVFIMTSTGDFLVNEPPMMVEKFKEMNVTYEYKVYGDDKVKPTHVFHCNIKDENAKKCNDDECAFFGRF